MTGATRRWAGTLAALLLAGIPAEGRHASGVDPFVLADRLEEAWRARAVEDYLTLWDFASPEARDDERAFALRHFAATGGSRLEVRRPTTLSLSGRLPLSAETFLVNEPRAQLEQLVFQAVRRADGDWALVERESRGRLDGLVHLSLHPEGYRADGKTIRLEDFDLHMARGTLFTSPEVLGPTVLVFVGEGSVRVHPRPSTEQEQLRQFCGRPVLADRVEAFFVRIHPADFHRVLAPAALERDPAGAKRFAKARAFYEAHASRSFVLDAALPGAPWWLLPSLGDALATFKTSKHGTLTFTFNANEAEGVALFDRTRRRQICLYPPKGRSTRYSEDDGRSADVLSHDLSVRFEPSQGLVQGEDTLRIRLLSPEGTLRLKLAERLRVLSVTSREAGSHRFFRVRHQDGLLVSLGMLTGTVGEIRLTVRYEGTLSPAPIDREVVQVVPPVAVEEIPLETALIYTNRELWYPQAGTDDHAQASLRLDVPRGYTALTGGERVAARVEGERTVVEYRQDRPAKYLTVAVGRFAEVASRTEGPVTLRAFGLTRTRNDASSMLVRAAEILRFYAGEFGPCPYPSLTLAVIEAAAPGGHSPPGMILLSRRPLLARGSLGDDPAYVSEAPHFFLAHEIAHQWWGHGIAGQNYRERWLSEGMAQYAAASWVRATRGEAAFRSVLRRMARWALRESDEGPISLGYRLGHLKGDPQIFRAVVYDKGAYVLHMLRGLVGDGAFREALRALQTERRYEKIGTDDLREALEKASGLDLSPYFGEWVHGTAVARLSFAWREERRPEGSAAVVDVRAQGLPAPVPLEIVVVHRAGREVRRVTLPPTGGQFAVVTPGRPTGVQVNADDGLLAKVEKR